MEDALKNPFNLLPPELIEKITSFLDNPRLMLFSATNWHAYISTSSERIKRKERKKREISALLEYVVKGDKEKAKAMLDSNPGFLLSRVGTTTDHLGRPISEKTAFQIALCTFDNEMCKMMELCFLKIDNGKAEMQSQFNEIFPKGLDAHLKNQRTNVFNFDPILQAIINASADEVTAALNKQFDSDLPLIHVLNKFREELHKKLLDEPIFNSYHILKAYETFDTAFDALGNLNKRDLFWRQIVGFSQQLASSPIKQALAENFYYIVDKNEPLTHSSSGHADLWGWGKKWESYSSFLTPSVRRDLSRGAWREGLMWFSDYVEKNITLGELHRHKRMRLF